MADFYVVFQDTTYEVATFDDGIAKARELGSGAVFYVNAPIGADNAYAADVNTVFALAEGKTIARLFAGAESTAVATSHVTVTGGTYSFVFTGGHKESGTVANSTLTFAGGRVSNMLLAGGWSVNGGTSIVNVTGGTISSLSSAPYEVGAVQDESTINISGGIIATYAGVRVRGRVNKATVNMTGGTITGDLIAGVGNSARGSVGTNTITVSGGVINRVFGGGNNGSDPGSSKLGSIENSNIILKGGTIVTHIYLGSAGNYAGTTGNVSLSVQDNALIKGSIYAGNFGGLGTLGNVTVKISGGTILGNVYAGSAGGSNAVGNIDLHFNGGTIVRTGDTGGYIYLGSYSNAASNIGNVTVTFDKGATAYAISGGANGVNTTKTNTITLNLFGGKLTGNRIYLTGSNAAITQAATTVNLDGFDGASSACWFYTAGKASAESITINAKSGSMHLLCLGSSSASAKITADHTVNLSGATINWLILSYSEAASLQGNITVNMTDGVIQNNFWMGNNKTVSGHTELVGDVTWNLSGGTVKVVSYAGGKNHHKGNKNITISGSFYTANNVYGGGMATAGTVEGNINFNITGGTMAGESSIFGGGYTGAVDGKVTINVSDKAELVNIYGGGNGTSATISKGVEINVSGGHVKGNIQGAHSAAVTGGVTLNISGGSVDGYISGAGSGAGGAVNGDVAINITDGILNSSVFGAGYVSGANVSGNVAINISGDALIQAGVYASGNRGNVSGNTTITVDGGTWNGSASYWICGGGSAAGVVEGSATIHIKSGQVYHIFGGGNTAETSVEKGVAINIEDGEIHGVVNGGGYRGTVNGGITINVSGGTFFRDMQKMYAQSGWIVGGAANETANITGDITVNVTGGTNLTTICGGNYLKAAHEGNISLTIANVTLGFMDGENKEAGNVYVVSGIQSTATGETFTGNISNVTSNGGLYACYGAANITGNTTITVQNSTFASVALEQGYFGINQETGAVWTSKTQINGDVLFDLTNVTVTGNVWGKSENYDMVSFAAAGQGCTLAVRGKLTVSDEVAYFQNITIAAGATIEANNVIASAITLDIAAVTETAATVITGFKAQDSAITLTANGTVLSTVTLSEVITSGRFINGSEVITVAVTDDQLTIQKAAVSADTVSGGASNTVLSEGTFDVAFTGGNRTAEATDFEGNYTIQLDDGNFNKAVSGGDTVTGAVNVTRTGNIDLVINGGTFSSNTRVCGGMFYNPNSAIEDKTAGSANLIGDVNFTIAGGRFDSRVFGGNNAKNDALGSRTMIDGSVNLTIDAGTAAITFNEHVLAGSRGSGAITGDTNVTITGKGDNLTFGADSVLFGGSNSDVVKVRANGSVDVNSAVLGDRNLIFSAFEGDFDAEIRLFNTISFVQNSTVDFTDAMLNLRAVSEWKFDFGSTASGIAVNDFAGDILNFNDLEGNVSPDGWVAISHSAIANLDQARIFLDGVEATSGVDGTWTTDLYQLKVDEDGTRLVIASLA
ncbi:MAG: hypothetical protein IJC73_00060 [Lentisphaeria bacterium]|nr:hypothetical protein [Lentisphaeria bacterium]